MSMSFWRPQLGLLAEMVGIEAEVNRVSLECLSVPH